MTLWRHQEAATIDILNREVKPIGAVTGGLEVKELETIGGASKRSRLRVMGTTGASRILILSVHVMLFQLAG